MPKPHPLLVDKPSDSSSTEVHVPAQRGAVPYNPLELLMASLVVTPIIGMIFLIINWRRLQKPKASSVALWLFIPLCVAAFPLLIGLGSPDRIVSDKTLNVGIVLVGILLCALFFATIVLQWNGWRVYQRTRDVRELAAVAYPFQEVTVLFTLITLFLRIVLLPRL